jgi:hypothetical protein
MSEKSEPKRQFVNFLGYKLNPAWRHLPEERNEGGARGTRGNHRAVADREPHDDPAPYSTVSIRADVDINPVAHLLRARRPGADGSRDQPHRHGQVS